MIETYDSANIFAKILRDEIPSNRVYEDEHVVAFHDVSPAAPVHVLVIPRGEYVSFEDFSANASTDTVTHFFQTVRHIAADVLKLGNGYRLITNIGEDGSQSVPHFHVHILAGKQLGGLLADDELIR